MKTPQQSSHCRSNRLPVSGPALAFVASLCFGAGYAVASATPGGTPRSETAVNQALPTPAISLPTDVDPKKREVSSGQFDREVPPNIEAETKSAQPHARHTSESVGQTASSGALLRGNMSQGSPSDVLTAGMKDGAFTFGRSQQGRPLTGCGLGEGIDVTLIFGAFHGDERNTKGIVERLHGYLQAHPQLLVEHRVILVPCVNPDGWVAGTRVNANGVDINRNFPYGWKPTGRSARANPGPSPFSEPESQAIAALLHHVSPNKIVSIHCPLHCVNYNGEHGQELAQAMQHVSSYPLKSDVGYPTPGSFGEYCEHQLGIGIVTLETDSSSAEEAWQANRAALLAAISYKAEPDANARLR